MKKLLIVTTLFLFMTVLCHAKEVTEIENMLNEAHNVGIINSSGSFMVCLLNKGAEYIVKFKVSQGGDYKIYTQSGGVTFEGRLLSRNFNYELITDCTDFNIPDKKRFFNCDEELKNSKTYYMYFTTSGDNPRLGCAKINIIIK